MANFVYNSAKQKLTDGTLSWATAGTTFKIMLLATDAVADNKNLDTVDQIVAEECTGYAWYTGGYAGAGRKTLANYTNAENDASDRTEMDADDAQWTTVPGDSGDVVAAAVIIAETGGADSSSHLVAHLDTGTGWPITVDASGNPVKVKFDITGIIHLKED